MTASLLEIRDLSISFRAGAGAFVRAVDHVSFSIPVRGTLGLVGESGSGKSVTALSMLRLLPEPPAHIDGGQVLFRSSENESIEACDLLRLPHRALRAIRGGQIGMIFQEPMTALNPVYTIGDQLGEALRAHLPLTRRAGLSKAVELLEQVGVADASRRAHDYPHQLSGGQRQRVMIAMALSCRPKLLIADEPTTALDVTTQAQILELLRSLQTQLGMSMLLISHDLGVISTVAQHVVVMYAGQVVESTTSRTLFRRPRHPYTLGLLTALPRLGASRDRLREIPGRVPRLGEWSPACRFAERCPHATERCHTEPPLLRIHTDPTRKDPDPHLVRCHHPINDEALVQRALA